MKKIGNKFGPICETHQFCAVDYFFRDEHKSRKEIEKEAESTLIQSLHCEALPDCHTKVYNAALSNLSEEALDDWIFQSFNRPLMGFLDPKRKFGIVSSYLEELKNRYYQLRMSNQLTLENREYYFQEHRKQKFIMQNGKQILNPNNLLFDHLYLSPKEVWPGQNVVVREESKLKRKRQIESRRNAIYLESDENYRKLEREFKCATPPEPQLVVVEPHHHEPIVESSGRELKYFAHLMPRIFRDQEEVVEQPVEPPITDQVRQPNRFNAIQIDLSKKHQQFKLEMEDLVRDFKEFLRGNPQETVVALEMKLIEEKIATTQIKKRIVVHKQPIIPLTASPRQKRPVFRPTLRPQSQESRYSSSRSTKQNKGLARQMINWYDIGKDEKYGLPLELKDQLQRAHSHHQHQHRNIQSAIK